MSMAKSPVSGEIQSATVSSKPIKRRISSIYNSRSKKPGELEKIDF
jgi:hypothetical protein